MTTDYHIPTLERLYNDFAVKFPNDTVTARHYIMKLATTQSLRANTELEAGILALPEITCSTTRASLWGLDSVRVAFWAFLGKDYHMINKGKEL